MSTITWLHLSDLHIQGAEGIRDRVLFDKMLSDIQTCLEEENLELDAVFFTGDLAFSGQQEEYTMATEMLDEILDKCGLTGRREKLFIVPGNHDVDWSAVRDSHKSFANDLLDPREETDESKQYARINKLLSDEDERAWFFQRFRYFGQFFCEFYADYGITFGHNNYYSVRAIEKDGHTIVVTGLNSAWMSSEDNKQGRLLLGEQQVCETEEEAKRRWPEPNLYIVLVHHPLYWLAEKDIHRVHQHLPRICDLLLRGHLHCPSYFVQSTPEWRLHEFAAGASWKARWHAYNLVKLDLESGEGRAFVQFQHPDYSVEWGPDSLTYRHAKGGRIEWKVELRE
jgi:calcineurin-like phosphoesterase family protein